MDPIKDIEKTFIFLVLEVKKQIEYTLKVVKNPSNKKLVEQINSRDDYIDNMKNVIENKVNSFLVQSNNLDKNTIAYTRAITVITSCLEHIADHAVNISRQTQFFKEKHLMKGFRYQIFFKEIIEAIGLIIEALEKKDIIMAQRICRTEMILDVLYKQRYEKIIKKLCPSEEPESLVAALFIFKLLERIGDSILNIGEAIMSVVIGERIKIHQYEALEESLGKTENEKYVSRYKVESIAETKSGNLVRRIEKGGEEFNPHWIIFKEGKVHKISNEKKSIEIWESIDPGLPPKILGFNKKRKRASLVLEDLMGKTLKDIIIHENITYLKKVFELFLDKTHFLWEKTKIRGEEKTHYLDQIFKRMEDIYKVHPGLQTEAYTIGDIEVKPLEDFIKSSNHIDHGLKAPFLIRIHGDFNNDNIIFKEIDRSIHYIDLHRSTNSDYVRDVSVFLISNYRMPYFENDIRKKINWINLNFLTFARNFSNLYHDETFEARLALGLARSFITSTRFELDTDFTKLMYINAVYLLEKLTEHKEDWSTFQVPDEILIYDGKDI